VYIGIQRRIASYNYIFFCGKAIPLGKAGDLPAGRAGNGRFTQLPLAFAGYSP